MRTLLLFLILSVSLFGYTVINYQVVDKQASCDVIIGRDYIFITYHDLNSDNKGQYYRKIKGLLSDKVRIDGKTVSVRTTIYQNSNSDDLIIYKEFEGYQKGEAKIIRVKGDAQTYDYGFLKVIKKQTIN